MINSAEVLLGWRLGSYSSLSLDHHHIFRPHLGSLGHGRRLGQTKLGYIITISIYFAPLTLRTSYIKIVFFSEVKIFQVNAVELDYRYCLRNDTVDNM